MWVIQQTRHYPKTESQKAMTVTSYFQHMGMFISFTSNIDNAKRFRTRRDAEQFSNTYFDILPSDVIEFVDVGETKQKERF